MLLFSVGKVCFVVSLNRNVDGFVVCFVFFGVVNIWCSCWLVFDCGVSVFLLSDVLVCCWWGLDVWEILWKWNVCFLFFVDVFGVIISDISKFVLFLVESIWRMVFVFVIIFMSVYWEWDLLCFCFLLCWNIWYGVWMFWVWVLLGCWCG